MLLVLFLSEITFVDKLPSSLFRGLSTQVLVLNSSRPHWGHPQPRWGFNAGPIVLVVIVNYTIQGYQKSLPQRQMHIVIHFIAQGWRDCDLVDGSTRILMAFIIAQLVLPSLIHPLSHR